MSIKQIQFASQHRRNHFEFFNHMDQPHFCVCADVDITHTLAHIKQHQLPFMPTIVYCVSDVANRIPELRWRIRGDQVVEHDVVHPSFAVATDEADVFSFCEVKFRRPHEAFRAAAAERMQLMRTNPVFEDDSSRDDYLFLSSLPWVTFTSIQHAMHYHPCDSVPRIIWGKFHKQGEAVLMPVSIQAHHAVVDGRHAGQFYDALQKGLDEPHRTLG